MTLAEKVRFVEELTSHVKQSLIEQAEKWPEEWDGHELRRLVARRFQLAVFGTMARTRLRAFNNECLIRHLL